MASQGVLNLANCGINRMPEKRFSWIEYIPVTFASVLFILQIVIGIYLLSEVSQIEVFAYFGVGTLCFFRLDIRDASSVGVPQEGRGEQRSKLHSYH
jgi:hypothetical protein